MRRANFARRPIDDRHRVSCFYWGDEASQECAQHARDILANLNRGALVGMTSAVRPIPRCGPSGERSTRRSGACPASDHKRTPTPSSWPPYGATAQWQRAVGRRERIYHHGDADEALRIADSGTTRDAHAARSLEPRTRTSTAHRSCGCKSRIRRPWDRSRRPNCGTARRMAKRDRRLAPHSWRD